MTMAHSSKGAWITSHDGDDLTRFDLEHKGLDNLVCHKNKRRQGEATALLRPFQACQCSCWSWRWYYWTYSWVGNALEQSSRGSNKPVEEGVISSLKVRLNKVNKAALQYCLTKVNPLTHHPEADYMVSHWFCWRRTENSSIRHFNTVILQIQSKVFHIIQHFIKLLKSAQIPPSQSPEYP